VAPTPTTSARILATRPIPTLNLLERSPTPKTGSTSTSEPHPSQDPEAEDRWEAPKKDKLDD
jgi:hypothetical protein